MALRLPKGIQFGFASILEASRVPVTALAAAAGGTLATYTAGAADALEGNPVLLQSSGWPLANNKVGVLGDDGVVNGVLTSTPELYPAAGYGVASLVGVGEWTDFTQQGEPSTSGGEQQFWQGALLEDPTGRQISLPTFKNAKTLTIPLYFDPSLPWYERAKVVDAIGKPIVLRAKMPGETLYWYGYLSFDADPSITANTPMGNTATFTMLQESTIVENSVGV